MKNGEKLEVFDEKRGFCRICLTGRGFWSKIVGDRQGRGRFFDDFSGFYEVLPEKWGFQGGLVENRGIPVGRHFY